MIEFENAPIWKRVFAWIYDGLIVLALILIAGLIASIIAQGQAPALLIQPLVLILVGGYFWLSFARGGKTAGMRAWRIRVVTEKGKVLSHRVALSRLLWATFCFAPILIPLATAWLSPHKLTIYDKLSKTRVISENLN